MIVVADSSPLIILSKIGCFELLRDLYSPLFISGEVHEEIVIAGAGLPGATQVAQSRWIEVKALSNSEALAEAQLKFGLGLGELSTIALAKELNADIALIDDHVRAAWLVSRALLCGARSGFWNCSIGKRGSWIFARHFVLF
jgi:predicted nucleic acid-binding protein